MRRLELSLAGFLVGLAFALARLAAYLAQEQAAEGASGGSVPIVDVSAFLSPNATQAQRESVAFAWDAAMSSVGIAVLTGHGVALDSISSLRSSASGFFQMPHDDKMRASLNKGYGFGGYVPQGVEAVARSSAEPEAPSDLVENYVFNHGGDSSLEPILPARPAEFVPDAQRYWREMNSLLHSLMRLSALALALPEHTFEAAFAEPKCNLRLAYYAGLPPASQPREAGMRYGAHTDYTGFTILHPDPQVGGLEIQAADGRWVAVPPQPDGLVINAGDLIQVWTNDRWRSPPHRVVNPTGAAAEQARLSLVFFTGPHDDTLVTALPTCHGSGNPPRYEAVKAGEHLMRKLMATNV